MSWTLASSTLVLNTTVPVSSIAHVSLPLHGLRAVTESGLVLWQESQGDTAHHGAGGALGILDISSEKRLPYPAIKVIIASGSYSMKAVYS